LITHLVKKRMKKGKERHTLTRLTGKKIHYKKSSFYLTNHTSGYLKGKKNKGKKKR